MKLKVIACQGAEIRDVPGFPGYGVSRDGLVWTKRMCGAAYMNMSSEWRQLSPTRFRTGHLYVGLCKNKKRVNRFVHVLVLTAFVGPRPSGFDACHNDGNPSNNAIENLRWDTRRQNQMDRVLHGTSNRGSQHPLSKLDEATVSRIRELYATGNYFQRQLGEMFGIHQVTVGKIVLRKHWQHL